MLYSLLVPMADQVQFFNLFRYITFRTAWGMVTALAICYFLYPSFITYMKKVKMEQIIRDYGPEHQAKVGTPTMGGVPMIISIATSDVESLDEDTNTIRGEVELLGTEDLESLESALDEKTSPSVTEVHSDALTPINYDEIEEKLAAVQALEFKGGEILSQPSEDPFINPGNNQGD